MPLKTALRGYYEYYMPANDTDVAIIRRKAAEFLKNYRDSGAGPIDIGPLERLPVSLAMMYGQPIAKEHEEFFLQDLAVDPWARGLKWRETPDPKRLADFSVTIIGAGMGGLIAAAQLKKAGIRHTVIEKNAGVGGTWYENRYPGARVDTPSRSYTNIFGVNFDYPNPYCEWSENERYFNWLADEFGVRENITFNTEVRSLVWGEDDSMWTITMAGPDGQRVTRSTPYP
jgi:4-hydroxyacetophenone monooxygenase